jgi:hypothetical protein
MCLSEGTHRSEMQCSQKKRLRSLWHSRQSIDANQRGESIYFVLPWVLASKKMARESVSVHEMRARWRRSEMAKIEFSRVSRRREGETDTMSLSITETEQAALLKLVEDLTVYKNRNSRILGFRFEHLPGISVFLLPASLCSDR